MKQIRLLDYIVKDQKVITYLNPKVRKKYLRIFQLKGLLGPLLDMLFCFMIYKNFKFLVSNGLSFFFNSYFLTSKNEINFFEEFVFYESLMIVYISSLFFFNDGQTLGLKMMGLRFKVEQKKIYSNIRSTLVYFLACISGGLFMLSNKFKTKIVEQDELYLKLFEFRDQSSVQIFNYIQTKNDLEKNQTTRLDEAA